MPCVSQAIYFEGFTSPFSIAEKKMELLKQPELGLTIQSLRKEKQLTQEELVEKCNVNVRTLQRIEAGEVTPRDFTIKAILAALDYQVEEVESSIRKRAGIRRLRLSFIAGIIFFVSAIAEAATDFSRFDVNLPFYFPLVYTLVKLVVVASYVVFMIGFVEVGEYFKSSLLKVGAYMMLSTLIVIELFDIISIFSGMTADEFWRIKGAEAVIFGGVDIVFGIALFLLAKSLGTISQIAGVVEILVGICLISFFLAFLGLFLMIPATILEVIILYKCYEMLQAKT